MRSVQKSVSEIIAGALEIFMRGPRGGRLRKARWNNSTLEDLEDKTYCALGALSMAACGKVRYPYINDNYKKAANLVASCIPPIYNVTAGMDIPDWNDGLSEKRGFVSVKRVFCKALKKSLKGRKRAA